MSDTRLDRAPDESDAALTRYRTRLRRQRLVYFSVVGAVVLALIVTVTVAWDRGEVANTSLHTVTSPPATLPIAAPAAAPRFAWRTSDRAALGNPRVGGTVVVYSAHTVRGLDARTGKQTWSYTRSNRTVCSAVQAQGRTVASYELNGNCDELTGLDSRTGKRVWTRTLDEDGRPLYGHPSYQVMGDTVMITSPSVIYTIVVDGTYPGYDRWIYSRFGCTIEHAVLGTAGALISQTCTNPHCTGIKFCGRGPQLLLRDGNLGVDDKTKNPTNFDHIIWNLIGNAGVPVSADGVLSALNPTTHSLDLFTATRGGSAGSVPLSPEPTSAGSATAAAVSDYELVSVGGVAAVLVGSGSPAWTREVSAPPTAVPVRDSDDLISGAARITVPTATGAAVLDGATGRVLQQVTLSPAPRAGASIYPLGTGQLAVGAAGTVAYR